MAKEFKLEIITPEKKFFSDDVEAVTATCVDGELTVLSGHIPMVAALTIGKLSIKMKDKWKDAFHSEGFMEIRPDEVLIFAQACEWPEEIDENRAKEAKERALEKLRAQNSIKENKHTQISLQRAMARLKVKQTKN